MDGDRGKGGGSGVLYSLKREKKWTVASPLQQKKKRGERGEKASKHCLVAAYCLRREKRENPCRTCGKKGKREKVAEFSYPPPHLLEISAEDK